MSARCDVVLRALDEWATAGMTLRLWWRDDDAVRDTPALRRLCGLAEEVGTVLGLAVIPARAEASLAKFVERAPCCVWQHGFSHKDNEFGDGRPLGAMIGDAVEGGRALDRLVGPNGWQRVFVPPFHALCQPFKARLRGLGYALSTGDPLTPRIDGLPEANAVDLVNWPDRSFYDEEVSGKLLAELAFRREGRVPAEWPLGLLTHHLALEEEDWQLVARLFGQLATHPAVEFLPADRLFAQPGPAPRRGDRIAGASGSRRGAEGEVTVVLTSCGRADLLERTLDSFLRYNTAPLREIIVIEDGSSANLKPFIDKYDRSLFKWLATEVRVGQMAAIDIAYAAVNTEFIFHCEDDWEFTAPGFIEKSLAVLRHNQSVLQVWIRALDDTNTHPLFEHLLIAGEVPYRLLKWDHDGGDARIWHGFSLNPGLRRLRDYRRLGTFAGRDPGGRKQGFEVEMAAAEFYRRQGLYAAILADENGRGYVRHIGQGRHVLEPLNAAHAPASAGIAHA